MLDKLNGKTIKNVEGDFFTADRSYYTVHFTDGSYWEFQTSIKSSRYEEKGSPTVNELPEFAQKTIDTFNKAVDKAVDEHHKAGRSVVIWQDGKIVEIPPPDLKKAEPSDDVKDLIEAARTAERSKIARRLERRADHLDELCREAISGKNGGHWSVSLAVDEYLGERDSLRKLAELVRLDKPLYEVKTE